MLRLLGLSLTQCTLLAFGQVFLKLAMRDAVKFQFTWEVIKSYLTNWPFLYCGLCMGGASLLWLYILKHYEFSVAYPLTSFSYFIGMLAALLIFHEPIPYTRWIGLGFIIIGTFFLLK